MSSASHKNSYFQINIVVLMDETNVIFGNNKGPLSQFSFSCNFVKKITDCLATACPNALVVVFTNPVTATLPLISEIYKTYNLYNPSKIIGSVALDSMKINAITANFLDLNPSCIRVPITGGVDSLTTVPLLSKTTPFNNLTAVRITVFSYYDQKKIHVYDRTLFCTGRSTIYHQTI